LIREAASGEPGIVELSGNVSHVCEKKNRFAHDLHRWTSLQPAVNIPAPPLHKGRFFFEGQNMGYKYKPSKSVAKRFKVTKTGKVKAHHGFTSHLMSSRSANKRRKLRKTQLVSEGHARNMREMMGVSGKKPNRVAHERRLAAAAKAKAAEPAAA
jgi:large subunit ribosomal protein L35